MDVIIKLIMDAGVDNDDLESLSSNMSNEQIASPTPVSNPHVPTLRRSTRISKPPDRLITSM